MDIEALAKALDDATVEVRLLGQTFTLREPSLADAGRVQRKMALASRNAPDDEDTRYDGFIAATLDAVELCLVEPVPRHLLERVVVRTGIATSPLIRHARVLVGMDAPGDEEDPDPDLPT